MNDRTLTLGFRLNPREFEATKQLAEVTGRKPAELAREALRRELQEAGYLRPECAMGGKHGHRSDDN